MSGQVTDAMVAAGASVLYRMELAFATEEYWAKEVYRAMLAAAPASPPPQGADSAHPQPSGNGLSEETLREAMRRAREIARRPSPPIPDLKAVLKGLINAVEARVRSQPVQQPTGWLVVREKPYSDGVAGHVFDSKESAQNWLRYVSRSRPEFNAAIPTNLSQPTPTDEWRRAVEVCAKVCETTGADWHDAGYDHKEYAAAYLAEQIRALSPTKPEHKPIAHAYHSRIKDGACTDCGQPKADHR